MSNETRSDLFIHGAGNASGGLYHEVEINGHGSIGADLECHAFRCNGHARIEGRVKAKSVKINGVMTTSGTLEADTAKIIGKATVKGNLRGETVQMEGDLSSTGDCEAEAFSALGRIRLDGLLNAGDITIELYGNCRVKEIGGDRIHIRRGHEIFNVIKRLFMPQGTKLHTDMIEGNEIHIHDTCAKVVRGANVTIGPGCVVDHVEYQETFHQDAEATVKDVTKV